MSKDKGKDEWRVRGHQTDNDRKGQREFDRREKRTDSPEGDEKKGNE